MKCRICSDSTDKILDLGFQPLANNLLDSYYEKCSEYPLEFYFCNSCQFGQVNDAVISSHIFDDSYPYYSSINTSYVEQCRKWAEDYRGLINPSSVLEVGCNDGYMLQNFKEMYHVGIEPSHGPYLKAKEKGLVVENCFFNKKSTFGKFDLIIANNVLAHTPDLHSMVEGMATHLSDDGQAVIEFPTLNNLVEKNQYDTIYHEHFSYFTLYSMIELFNKYGLLFKTYDILSSHGGSLRAYFNKKTNLTISSPLLDMKSFSKNVFNSKIRDILIMGFLKSDKRLCLFGAAAKGNTFLNYLGIKRDIFDFCVDETPFKQGKFLPGSRIEICSIDRLREQKPEVVWILPWNFKDEIMDKLSFIKEWGGSFAWKI